MRRMFPLGTVIKFFHLIGTHPVFIIIHNLVEELPYFL